MRRVRNHLTILMVAVATVAAGCGVAANDVAATIGGHAITIETVDDLAREPAFTPGGGSGLSDAVLPGDLARSALMFEITRVSWISEAERWGLDLNEARDQASLELDNQLARNSPTDELSDSMRERFVEYYAAQLVLQKRFQDLDPDNSSDLRMIYDGVPGLWKRTCAWVIGIPEGAEKKVSEQLAKGTELSEIPEKVKGVATVADPTQSCLSDPALPPQMRDDIDALPVGRVSDVITIDQAGTEQKFIAQVESRESVTFADAQGELTDIVSSLLSQGPQPWIQAIVSTAKIDPRFGEGVTTTGNGEPAIIPPPKPLIAPGHKNRPDTVSATDPTAAQ